MNNTDKTFLQSKKAMVFLIQSAVFLTSAFMSRWVPAVTTDVLSNLAMAMIASGTAVPVMQGLQDREREKVRKE